MQSDEGLDETLVTNDAWSGCNSEGTGKEINRLALPTLERGKLSFSGKERNHLYRNVNGESFDDVTGISGLDSEQDGRSVAVLDFDRDGWQDVLLLNINTPVLSLYRNLAGELDGLNSRNMVAFEFVGGNKSAKPSSEFGPRDGYGARVSITIGGESMVRQFRCGEGLAAQNTKYLLFGIRERELVDSAVVHWPTGATQTLKNIPAGSLVTVFENASESNDGSGFKLGDYLIEKVSTPSVKNNQTVSTLVKRPDSSVTLYASVPDCSSAGIKMLDELLLLREVFSKDQLSIVAIVPDPLKARNEVASHLASDELLFDDYLVETQVNGYKSIVRESLGVVVAQASVLVRADGVVAVVKQGSPTISQIKSQIPQ